MTTTSHPPSTDVELDTSASTPSVQGSDDGRASDADSAIDTDTKTETTVSTSDIGTETAAAEQSPSVNASAIDKTDAPAQWTPTRMTTTTLDSLAEGLQLVLASLAAMDARLDAVEKAVAKDRDCDEGNPPVEDVTTTTEPVKEAGPVDITDLPEVLNSKRILDPVIFGTFDGKPESLDRFLARLRFLSSWAPDESWRKAVLEHAKLSFEGKAAVWYGYLSARDRASMSAVDVFEARLRKLFPPQGSGAWRAERRTWWPADESQIAYLYDKLFLNIVHKHETRIPELAKRAINGLPVLVRSDLPGDWSEYSWNELAAAFAASRHSWLEVNRN